MKKIKLSLGKYALVDDDVFYYLNLWNWHCDSHGYASKRVVINGNVQRLGMHNFILNIPKGYQPDHKNGNRLDNRRCNLRIATLKQNSQNRKPKRGSSSKYKGVSRDGSSNRWKCRILADGKNIHIGMFGDQIDAAKCYDVHAVKYFHEFAHLNFPALAMIGKGE